METVLFTDHAVVVFAVITGALALIFFGPRTCNNEPDTF